MAAPAHTNFLRAFTAGTVFRDSKGTEYPVRQLDAGELVLTTGRVLACDPNYLQVQGPESLNAFTRTVGPGRYPVSVCLAHFTYPMHKEERVAAAIVRFTDAQPVRWELALTPGQDPATLLPDHFFGYGVDSGTGCFTDAQILEALAPEREQFTELCRSGQFPQMIRSIDDVRKMKTPFFQRLLDGFFGGNLFSGSGFHTTVVADEVSGLNLIAFSSGWGDGAYASFWGLDAKGKPCCLATDFGLLVESFEETLTFQLGDGLRTFVHQDLLDRGIAAIEVKEEIEDPAPEWLKRESFDYKLTLQVQLVGRGSLDCPQVRINGREYHCRMSSGSQFWYYLDQPLTGDAELVVKYMARTVPLQAKEK